MELLRYLRKESKDFDINIILIGIFAGVVNLALIVILTKAATQVGDVEESGINLALAGLCLAGFWYSKRYLLMRTTMIVEAIIGNVRRRIADNIRKSDLSSFENIGAESLINAVSLHANTLSQASIHAINHAHSVVMVSLAFVFIFVISKSAFFIVTGVLALLVWSFFRNRQKLSSSMRNIAEGENDFLRGFTDLTTGFKEIKMNSRKDREFVEGYLHGLIDRCIQLKLDTGAMLNKNLLIAHSSLFVLLGAVIFILPILGSDEVEHVVPVATVVIFIFGPFSDLVGAIPFMAHAVASIGEIERIEGILGAFKKENIGDESPQNLPIDSFEQLTMEHVHFQYRDEANDRNFELGPIDFKINQGELVFMVGGNGSGKSTFLKVLTGLYPPDTGTIHVNDITVTHKELQGYRNLMAPIFTDFHLFDKLYGIDPVDEKTSRKALEQVELTDKTELKGKDITNISLSAGQRKRLALMVSMLEDKPIMVFDEWAAEQDPEFRRKFYLEIVPALRASGKTIFAITHDDKYFYTADRIVKMDYGQFVDFKPMETRPEDSQNGDTGTSDKSDIS
ncbi:MAG: cyclic peptide export ABC transporter [Verrucomicrobia bacterium]|jgi:putative pyoverdin transport system ATP-binding/permease protein|nr:cyclic peptide export ABC transporter [Verrucomicrobiota bacterium]